MKWCNALYVMAWSFISLNVALHSPFISPAHALEDELVMPAMKTNKAHKNILTDVTQAGARLLAVGERGHIIYSEDNGNTWTQAEVPVRVNLTAIHFPTADKGWASGHCGVILHSEDGGKTWQKQIDGTACARIILASAQKEVARLEKAIASAEGAAREALEWELENAQFRLEDAQRDVEVGPAKPIMDLWFKNELEGFGVGAYGYFFHTADGGKTWEDYATKIDNPDGLHLYAINGLKGGAIFIAGEEGNIFRSKDGGVSWEHLDSPYEGGLFGVLGTDIPGQVCVFGLKGNAFFSSKAGDTWEQVKTGSGSSLYGGLALSGNRFVFVGQDGTLLKCGGNATPCEVIPRSDRNILSATVPVGENELLLVGMGGSEVIALNP